MKRLQAASLFATVQCLMVTVVLGTALPARAVDCSPHDGYTFNEVDGKCEIASCPKGSRKTSRQLESGKILYGCEEREAKDSREVSGCDDKSKDMNSAYADQKKACSEAGLDVQSCTKEVQACISKHNEAADNEALDLSALQAMMPNFGGQTLSIPSMGLKKDVCPTEGSKDYFDEKDRLQRDLKEIDRENADIEKDIADEKSKLDKEMKDAQDELTKARKDVEKKKLELNKEESERSTEMVKRTQDIAKQLQDLNTQDLQKRAEVSKYESDHNRRLLQMNEQMAQAKCMNEVRKARDEMMKAGLFATSGSSSFMANATAKKNTLQQTYDICVKDFHEQRIAMLNEYRDKIRGFNQELQNIQESVQSAQAAMKNENEQAQKAMEDLKKAATAEDQNLIQQMQNAQNNLMNLNTTMQQKQSALRQKQASIQQRKIQLQKDLDGLGPVPKRGTKTGWREAERAVQVVAQKGVEFKQCCTVVDSNGEKPFEGSSYCKAEKQREYLELLGDKSTKNKSGTRRSGTIDEDGTSSSGPSSRSSTKSTRGSR